MFLRYSISRISCRSLPYSPLPLFSFFSPFLGLYVGTAVKSGALPPLSLNPPFSPPYIPFSDEEMTIDRESTSLPPRLFFPFVPFGHRRGKWRYYAETESPSSFPPPPLPPGLPSSLPPLLTGGGTSFDLRDVRPRCPAFFFFFFFFSLPFVRA